MKYIMKYAYYLQQDIFFLAILKNFYQPYSLSFRRFVTSHIPIKHCEHGVDRGAWRLNL